MKILITGAKGFLGKNLVNGLKVRGYTELFEYDKDTEPDLLYQYLEKADFIYHLAGVNRSDDPEDFWKGNYELTNKMVKFLLEIKNTCPVMYASSCQASNDSVYGKSKKAAEELLMDDYSTNVNTKVYIYRFPNLFGKWCRPNYNSVVATFCHNIAEEQPITIHNKEAKIDLVYIDDAVDEIIKCISGEEHWEGDYCFVPEVYKTTVKELADSITSFHELRKKLSFPDFQNIFIKKLYSTYLSYLNKDKLSYQLDMKIDKRGSFTEFLKTRDKGQISVNIIKPGITKGNHWHCLKTEKFLVVSGTGIIRLRQINEEDFVSYFVNGEKLEVIDIPVGYTHSIENSGVTDMVVIIWVNEQFDPGSPDTYYLEVKQHEEA